MVNMLTEKFFEVLKHEGVVAIVTSSSEGPHLVNTWSSYRTVTNDERILIPAYAMRRTEKNCAQDNNVIISVGSRDVEGHKGYQGKGFIIRGTARFFDSRDELDMMKKKFSFLTRILEITVSSCKQML
jgi:hypothetical protein